MSNGTNNGTTSATQDENDTDQNDKVPPGPVVQRATSFSQIDFVDFIRKRQMLGDLDLHRLMAVPVFCDTAADFWHGRISLGAASHRISNGLIKAGSDSIMPGVPYVSTSRRASRAVALAGYCSMLKEDDPRRVTLEPQQRSEDMLQKYVDPATGEPYPIQSVEDVTYRTHAEKRDRQEYIIHWSRAFSSSFERLIGDKRILARIDSAPYFGVDYVTEILGLAANELPDDLPCIDSRLRVELIQYLNLLRLQGLLQYEFDPKHEFPSYFSDLPFPGTFSSQ